MSTLILYCQKLDPLHGSEDNEIDNCKNGSSSSINNAIPEKCVVYRKTDENDVFFAGVKKGSSGKKSGKKQKVTTIRFFLMFRRRKLIPFFHTGKELET